MNREKFLAGRELKTVEVELPEFGTVKLRELPDSVRIRDFDYWLRPNGEKLIKARQQDARFKLITLCVVGDDNAPLLNEEDIPRLREFPSPVISRLAEVAMSLSGLSDEDIDGKLKKTSGD